MKILHIIDSLDKIGGAERLLLDYVNHLSECIHLVVVLNGLKPTALCDKIEFESLDFSSYFDVVKSTKKLKKVITRFNPNVIHAHLPLSTFITRLANQDKIKLYFSVHNTYSKSLMKTSSLLYWMENLLSSRKQTAIFVSKSVKEDYMKIIKFNGTVHVLHNFVSNTFFEPPFARPFGNREKVKVIAVGNVKDQKNYKFLAQCITELQLPYTLDIYGRGELTGFDKKVQFKGWCDNISTVLHQYDLLVSSSIYEGFGLAPLEAAAKGLPVILSNLDVYKEVTAGKAIYFDPQDKESLKKILVNIYVNSRTILDNADELKTYVQENYKIENYAIKLMDIYNERLTIKV